MIHPVDTLLALVLLSVLFSFRSSRLPTLIKVLPFRGWWYPLCRFSWGTT
jgi:hydrogenase-4 component E